MYKKAILLILLFLTWANATDITKAAISKLIDRSYILEKRVNLLEKEVAILKKQNVTETIKSSLLKDTFYLPRNASFVRKAPFKEAKKVAIANKKTQIFEIFCSNKNDIFWGKSNRGWIYISNPSYGTIEDNNNNIIDKQDTIKWCGM